MADGFHGGSRSLQARFDTRALADRIDALLVSDTISEGDRAFIADRTDWAVRCATRWRPGPRSRRTEVLGR